MARKNFFKAGLNQTLVEKIHQTGFENLTPIQFESIPVVLGKRDLLGLSQAGTGKTLAFGWPLLQRIEEGEIDRILILTPTRELARQVLKEISRFSELPRKAFLALCGGSSFKEQQKALRFEPRILVGTPGRIRDLCDSGDLDLKSVNCLVLDEVDRILDMGFRREIDDILPFLPKRFQALLFSATMSAEVEKLVLMLTESPIKVQIGSITRPMDTIRHTLWKMASELRLNALYALLTVREQKGPWMVFARTRENVDLIFEFVLQFNPKAIKLHGGMLAGERQRSVSAFQRESQGLLICTDIASRGIHVDSVELIISLEFPGEPENFIHRIGRTGRAKQRGEAITFLCPAEIPAWKLITSESDFSYQEDSALLPMIPGEYKVPKLKESLVRISRGTPSDKKGSDHVKVFTQGKSKKKHRTHGPAKKMKKRKKRR